MRISPWVIVALAACGDDSNRSIIDAPIGQLDGPVDGGPPAAVTVTVQDGANNVAGVQTYFQNLDSSVVAMPMTDTSGTASAVMAAGGFVTIVYQQPTQPKLGGPSTQYRIFTWKGVKPGDKLKYDQFNSFTSTTQIVNFIVPTSSNVVYYGVWTTCGDSNQSVTAGSGAPTSVTLTVAMDCSTADVLVVGYDVDSAPVSYFSVPAQAVVAGDINYSTKTYTAATTRTYEIDNSVFDSTIQLSENITTPRGLLYSPGSSLDMAGNPSTGMTSLPVGPAGSLNIVYASQRTDTTDREFYEWGTSGAYTLDWGTHLLPDFTATAPTFDTGTHTVGWTATTGGLTADFVAGGLFVFRSTYTFEWGEVAPADGSNSLALPTLPAGTQDFNIAAADDFNVESVGTGKAPGGYDAVRPVFNYGPPAPSGATGFVVFNQYSAGPTKGGGGLLLRKPAVKRGVMALWNARR